METKKKEVHATMLTLQDGEVPSPDTKKKYRLKKGPRKAILFGLVVIAVLAILVVVSYFAYFAFFRTDQNVQISNVTSKSATVVWVSRWEEPGSALAFEGGAPGYHIGRVADASVGFDDRDYAEAELTAAVNNQRKSAKKEEDLSSTDLDTDVKIKKFGRYAVHHVTFRDLEPNTEYEVLIGDGYLYKGAKGSEKYTFTTRGVMENFDVPYPAYGLVLEKTDVPVTDGVFTLHITNGNGEVLTDTVTAPIGDNGSWYLDLNSLFAEDGTRFLDQISEYEFTTLMENHQVITAEGVYQQELSTEFDAPSPNFILGDALFREVEESVLNALLDRLNFGSSAQEPTEAITQGSGGERKDGLWDDVSDGYRKPGKPVPSPGGGDDKEWTRPGGGGEKPPDRKRPPAPPDSGRPPPTDPVGPPQEPPPDGGDERNCGSTPNGQCEMVSEDCDKTRGDSCWRRCIEGKWAVGTACAPGSDDPVDESGSETTVPPSNIVFNCCEKDDLFIPNEKDCPSGSSNEGKMTVKKCLAKNEDKKFRCCEMDGNYFSSAQQCPGDSTLVGEMTPKKCTEKNNEDSYLCCLDENGVYTPKKSCPEEASSIGKMEPKVCKEKNVKMACCKVDDQFSPRQECTGKEENVGKMLPSVCLRKNESEACCVVNNMHRPGDEEICPPGQSIGNLPPSVCEGRDVPPNRKEPPNNKEIICCQKNSGNYKWVLAHDICPWDKQDPVPNMHCEEEGGKPTDPPDDPTNPPDKSPGPPDDPPNPPDDPPNPPDDPPNPPDDPPNPPDDPPPDDGEGSLTTSLPVEMISAQEIDCTIDNKHPQCKRASLPAPAIAGVSDLFGNISNTFSRLVSSVNAQSDNSQIIFSPEDMSYVFKVEGKYYFTFEGQPYEVKISEASASYVIYLDEDGNGQYDPDIDRILSEDPVNLAISKVSSARSYDIAAGFNLISFDFIPDEGGSLASDYLAYLNSMFEENDEPFYSLATYVSGQWKIIGARDGGTYGADDFQIVPGRGYLLRSKYDVDLDLSGFRVDDPVPVSLVEGWNLVAVHGASDAYTAEGWLDSIDSVSTLDADNVTRWDTSRGKYDGIQKESEAVYGFDFPIMEQSSYFVRVVRGSDRWTPE